MTDANVDTFLLGLFVMGLIGCGLSALLLIYWVNPGSKKTTKKITLTDAKNEIRARAKRKELELESKCNGDLSLLSNDDLVLLIQAKQLL